MDEEEGTTLTRDAKKNEQQLTIVVCFSQYLKNPLSIQKKTCLKFSRTDSLFGLDVDWSLDCDHLNFSFLCIKTLNLCAQHVWRLTTIQHNNSTKKKTTQAEHKYWQFRSKRVSENNGSYHSQQICHIQSGAIHVRDLHPLQRSTQLPNLCGLLLGVFSHFRGRRRFMLSRIFINLISRQ